KEEEVEVPAAPTPPSPSNEPSPPPQEPITTPPQWRKDDDNVVIKDASATEPTMFDDKEVTITMVQTLIKMKAKKARLFDEQMAKRLHDEEVKQAVAREKQEKDDMEKDKVRQQQYVDKQENIDWNVVVEQMQKKHLDNIRYMDYPIMWKLHSNNGVHQVSSTTRRHEMCMLTEKDHPLSNGVMTLILSTRYKLKKTVKWKDI
nr:hypothetical protein [Tanacetum cinerariifolium]